MKNYKLIQSAILFCIIIILFKNFAQAQPQTATVVINDKTTHQKITGFGGFVNSPQFGYNHMSEAEIKKIWGNDSETKYNIMRIYISSNESSWLPQAVPVVKLAKSLGLIVFASPWSMPAAWKTNNSTVGTGSLKEENYGDYAAYLNRFATLMRENGAELDAVSIQNEPDWDVSYDGCRWTPAQITKFLKEHRSSIQCKIIVPETVGLSNENYVNTLIADDVIDQFDIYAGHQYGGVGTAHQKIAEKGKEVWMTEYLINWNENATRNFQWSLDAFDFTKAINNCMLSNVNAWINYSAKRFYGMLGDGQYGTVNGAVTKRGYLLSHYAQYVTGATRIENTWKDDSNALDGSSYLSVTGDSIIAIVINPSNNAYTLTVDLPFYSTEGKSITTTETTTGSENLIRFEEETIRPNVDIPASSITTLIFTKSSERPASQMTGEEVHPDKIENQTVVGAAFGSAFQLSGKTAMFRNGNPLISSITSSASSYLKLNEPFNRLVFHVENLSSTMSYVSANTTLYYINAKGTVCSHNYGEFTFNKRDHFDWVFDISRNVLTDGCNGILSITNGNYSSELTFRFGDVYFTVGSEKLFKFSGVYSRDDSNLLDCLADVAYTSLDFTETSGITSEEDWNASAVNNNCIYYVNENIANNNPNIISGSVCSSLELTDEGGNFYAPVNFTATTAAYQCLLSGYKMLVLPFEVNIPAGISAYTLAVSAIEVNGTRITGGKIPANTPVLVNGYGSFIFNGTGNVSSPRSLKVNDLNGIYIAMKLPSNSYYLQTESNTPVFYRASNGEDRTVGAFDAYLTAEPATAATLPVKLDNESSIEIINNTPTVLSEDYYSLLGQRVYPVKNNLTGIYIVKSLMSDGSVISRKIYIRK